MANSIKDSLLYKTLLSKEMDFTGDAEGPARLQTLTQRIKKMEQSDRKELWADLNQILKYKNGQNATPLQERGVCVLLLAGYGTHKETHNIIDSFFRFLRNSFGERISSQSIIETIRAIQANDTALRQSLNLSGVGQNLVNQQAIKQQAKDGNFFQQKMTELSNLKGACEAAYKSISERLDSMQIEQPGEEDIYNIARKSQTVIDLFVGKDLPAELTKLIGDLKWIADSKGKKGLNILQELQQQNNTPNKSAYLTAEEIDLVNVMIQRLGPNSNSIPPEIQRNIIKLVYSSSLSRLNALKNLLEINYESEEAKDRSAQSEIDLLEKRVSLLARENQILAFDQTISDKYASLDKELKNMREIDSFLCLIDAWTKKLGRLNSKQLDGPEMLADVIDGYLESINGESSPNRTFFMNHLIFLYNILPREQDKYQTQQGIMGTLYPDLQLFNTDTEEEKGQKKELLAGLNSWNPLDSLTFVENYLKCLKFALSKKHALCVANETLYRNAISDLKNKRNGVGRLPPPGLPPLPNAPHPNAAPVLPPLPPAQNLGGNLNPLQAQLEDLARRIETDNTPNSLNEAIRLLETRDDIKTNDIKGKVCHNFYCIMIGMGKIKKDQWGCGEDIFKGKNLNDLTNATPKELRTCRAKALRLVAREIMLKVGDPIPQV